MKSLFYFFHSYHLVKPHNSWAGIGWVYLRVNFSKFFQLMTHTGKYLGSKYSKKCCFRVINRKFRLDYLPSLTDEKNLRPFPTSYIVREIRYICGKISSYRGTTLVNIYMVCSTSKLPGIISPPRLFISR